MDPHRSAKLGAAEQWPRTGVQWARGCRPCLACVAIIALGVMALAWSPPARACSPAPPSDWRLHYSTTWNGEEEAPLDLRLRLELERWWEISGTGFEADFDPGLFVMTCDGSPVAGEWRTPAPDRLWRFPGLYQSQGRWSSHVGCSNCESGVSLLQASFEPDAELPPEASCEVTLLERGDSVSWVAGEPNAYPWVFLSFTTGLEIDNVELDLGEPEIQAILYDQERQACAFGPDLGSCMTCVTQETETRFGAVFTFPNAPPDAGSLLVHVYAADTEEGLATANPETLWLWNLPADTPPALAMDLGAEGDPPRCAQVVLEDRRGRQTKRSAPICVDPAEMPWPEEAQGGGGGGCGCASRAPGNGRATWLLLFAVLLAYLIRRRVG